MQNRGLNAVCLLTTAVPKSSFLWALQSWRLQSVELAENSAGDDESECKQCLLIESSLAQAVGSETREERSECGRDGHRRRDGIRAQTFHVQQRSALIQRKRNEKAPVRDEA